jgi:SAM-dependent methyltransferase
MKASRLVAHVLAAMCVAAFVTYGALAQYQPQVGQEGKDVVWVPSAEALVEKMLDLAEVKPGDYVIDLGSGDGRTVIAAARRGARALGIEYNPRMVALAKRNAARTGVADRVTFVEGDIFASDFSEATVLTLFLMPELNLQLLPTILNMKPGTRVVSNSFDMGDWKPDRTVEVTRECKTYCQALLWIVPAKVEGTWRLELLGQPEGAADYHLELQQTYQFLSGTLAGGPHAVIPVRGRLKGSEITFTDTGDPHKFEFKGEVKGDRAEGSYTTLGRLLRWSATRK